MTTFLVGICVYVYMYSICLLLSHFYFIFIDMIGSLLGTLYNLSYIVIVNLILQAIFSTLIMDTFSTMRVENDHLRADASMKCFICSIDRFKSYHKYNTYYDNLKAICINITKVQHHKI